MGKIPQKTFFDSVGNEFAIFFGLKDGNQLEFCLKMMEFGPNGCKIILSCVDVLETYTFSVAEI